MGPFAPKVCASSFMLWAGETDPMPQKLKCKHKPVVLDIRKFIYLQFNLPCFGLSFELKISSALLPACCFVMYVLSQY